MRRFIAAAAALLAVSPSIAQAAEAPCLSPAEFASLAEYALPSMITGATQRCSSTLGANAWLPRNGPQLAQRYAQRRAGAWNGAKAAFLKLSPTINPQADQLIRGMPDASLQQLLDPLLAGMVSQQLPLQRCGAVDRLIGLLSPLPAESTAELIALGVGLGAKAGLARFGAITVCAA